MTVVKNWYDTLRREEWRDVPGHEGYAASNFGRIKNVSTNKILSPVKIGPKRKQYYAAYVGDKYKIAIHRMVLSAFVERRPCGNLACHKDDDSLFNHLDNLYWGTHNDNVRDQINSGKFHFAIGESNGMTKYSDALIKKIRLEYTGKRGEQSALAKKYGMSVSNVNMIVRNRARRLWQK